jgi:hypothetical protein
MVMQYFFMKNKYPFLLFSFIILIASCSPDVVTVEVIRNPSVSFDYNTSAWKSSSYSFTAPARVVVYPGDTTQPGKFYNRLTMQAFGKDAANNDLQLIVSFDAVDANVLVGAYTPDHNTQRGLANVQLYNLSNSNNLMAYQLCADPGLSVLTIKRQSQAERLVSGSFRFTLCNVRDTTQKIILANGMITDIRY